jgi:hypothetical protein
MPEINQLNEKIVKENLANFKNGLIKTKDEGREPWARYASFDYCFNYFQDFENKNEIANSINIQNSCLHLAFYLASWGMLRGSSFLLQKSIKFYEPLINYISKKDCNFWKIDVSNYSDENIKKLIDCYKDIEKILSENGKHRVSDTLITKIMLGIFGNVPAFDAYFKKGSKLKTFNNKSLKQILEFYNNYNKIISKEASDIKTFNFCNKVKIKRSYTKAKIVDMIFFIEGYKK